MIAETAVIAAVTEKGYNVSLPLGEYRYDLVVEKNGTFRRIQVKYCTPKNGILFVRCYSISGNKNNVTIKRLRYSSNDVDYLAVYDSINKDIYFIKYDVFNGKTVVCLRLNDTKNNQSKLVRWAKDFKEME